MAKLDAQLDFGALWAPLVRNLRHRAIFVMDLNGSIASWNAGVEELLGYTEEEFVGHPVELIFTPEDRARHEAEKERAEAAQRGAASDVRWHVRKDGSRCFIDGLLVAARDTTGKLAGFAKLMSDATDRLAAYEKVEGARAYLHSIVDGVPQPILLFDPVGGVRTANHCFYDVFQATPSQVEGLPIDQLVGGKLAQRPVLHLIEQAATGAKRLPTAEIEAELPIAGSRTLEVNVSAVEPESGGGMCVLMVITDVTERRRAEAAREQLVREQRAMLEAAGVQRRTLEELTLALDQAQVMVRALDGTIQFWSHGDERLYGWTAEEAAGRLSHALLQTEFPEPLENIDAHLRRNGTWQGELRHTRRDGGVLVVASHWALQRNASGEPVAVIESNTDITDRRRIEQELRRSNEDLQQFGYVVSHDLQAPLRAVRGYAELLERRYKDKLDDTAQEYISLLKTGVHDMRQLIDSLLEYAQAGEAPPNRECVNVEDVLQTVLASLAPEIGEAEAEITHEPLPELQSDAVHLRQLLQNLISNAIKYARPEERPRIHIFAERRPSYWLFGVRDNGQGIRTEWLDKVFAPLTRLHGRDVPGTGIGLAVAKKIVDRAGGEIWAESQPDVGSTFYFTLPA